MQRWGAPSQVVSDFIFSMEENHKHETKVCPRCGQTFACKSGDVLKCQCYGIIFTEKMQQLIATAYEDCLCSKCLTEIREES